MTLKGPCGDWSLSGPWWWSHVPIPTSVIKLRRTPHTGHLSASSAPFSSGQSALSWREAVPLGPRIFEGNRSGMLGGNELWYFLHQLESGDAYIHGL